MSCRRVVLGLTALGAALAIIACSDICARSSDCTPGLVCSVAGACVLPPVDAAGGGDGGGTTATADASTDLTDAGATDADATDAEVDARVGT